MKVNMDKIEEKREQMNISREDYVQECIAWYIKETKEKTLAIIEEVFSEGFFNYFHTTYGSDDMSVNDEMIEDIAKKIKELKEKLMKK